MYKIENFIDGDFITAVPEHTIESINPAINKVHALLPDSDADTVEIAYKAAKKAFPSWSKTSLETRHDFLQKLASLIMENRAELAKAESEDNGKPFSLAYEIDIPRAAANLKFFATAAMQLSTECHEMPNQALNYTLRQPIGVVGCISPWNLPLYLFTWKIAPALAAGNTVVAKPSEITPLTAFLFSKLVKEAGLPNGVLNIVHGKGSSTGAAIVSHPGIKAISFTGGTKTGEHIARTAAPMFKKLSLELGGKNPTIVFADCDYENTLSEVVRASFSNQGQICLCGSRILVEDKIYDKFKLDLVNKVNALNVGDPLGEDTNIGALVSEDHFNKVLNYIEIAKQEGGKIIAGGKPVKVSGRCANGFFIAPTIIDGLDMSCRTNQEEIFGPVITIASFSNDAEAIAMANATPYGLASSIWTTNLKRAHHVASSLDCGLVWVNTWMLRDLRVPFGGTKQSGVGREGGWEALRFFTEAKNITIKY
ncbi:MAG: aldehyde dehydrogenase [Saprospiraceae bacterium]|nr:aldehyde dehydrogenase [Saprospiraceae bacterium]